MSDQRQWWFAPKRYGYGAGRPITLQGWGVTIGYLALAGLSTRLLRHSWVGFFSIFVMLTVTFTIIAMRTTRGGWRWRWGKED